MKVPYNKGASQTILFDPCHWILACPSSPSPFLDWITVLIETLKPQLTVSRKTWSSFSLLLSISIGGNVPLDSSVDNSFFLFSSNPLMFPIPRAGGLLITEEGRRGPIGRLYGNNRGGSFAFSVTRLGMVWYLTGTCGQRLIRSQFTLFSETASNFSAIANSCSWTSTPTSEIFLSRAQACIMTSYLRQINQLIILRVFSPLCIRPEASNPFQVLSFWFDTIDISQNTFVVHFSPKKN